MDDLQEKYSSLLRDYCWNNGEKHSSRAADLGTEFAAVGLLPADIAGIHQQATLQMDRDGATSRDQVVSFLAKVLMGYGLASFEVAAGSAAEPTGSPNDSSKCAGVHSLPTRLRSHTRRSARID